MLAEQIIARVSYICFRLQLQPEKILREFFPHLTEVKWTPQPVVFEHLGHLIDHTILKPDAKLTDIIALCNEAVSHRLKAICVNSSRVKPAVQFLQAKKNNVTVAVVVGFPLGACATEVKRSEATFSLEAGADEIDMVLNIGALKDEDYATVFSDINTLASLVNCRQKVLKVILETGLLSVNQIIDACIMCTIARCQFVKTSTGFGPRGASVEDVKLMRAVVGDQLQVKASGGIRNRKDALDMVAAGASRIGTSASVVIVTGSNATAAKY